jgi:uncharacterized flavoprotein (TIGR03862 family)
MPSVCRKFLLAGKGGLNLTHTEEFSLFLQRYRPLPPQLADSLNQFKPNDLISWAHGLGIKTFTGSSGRVFPDEMKAAPLLRAWLHRLRQSGVSFHMRHRWLGWDENEPGNLIFETPDGAITRPSGATVLALGGASWPQLGATGHWVESLQHRGIHVNPLAPANSGFDAAWAVEFRLRYAGQPLKSVVARFADISRQGDCVITEYGLEGGLIYAFSADIRDCIQQNGDATITLDLLPNLELAQISKRLALPRGSQSLSNHLRKKLRLDALKQGLLRETLNQQEIHDFEKLALVIKNLPVRLTAPRPIAEAISSAGGVCFDELDEHLMLKSAPGVFCAGEMLDWEAPTGGYLLTGCFTTGLRAGAGVLQWLETRKF